MIPWLDIIIVAVFVISVIKGYKDGFTKSFLLLVQFIACIAVSYIFYPRVAKYLLENAGWVDSIEKMIHNMMSSSPNVNALAQSITSVIISIICFVGLYFACWIIFKVIILIANKIAEIPVLKQVNKIGGIIVGAFKGLLLSVAFSTVVWLVASFGSDFLTKLCNSSYFVKILYIGSLIERF